MSLVQDLSPGELYMYGITSPRLVLVLEYRVQDASPQRNGGAFQVKTKLSYVTFFDGDWHYDCFAWDSPMHRSIKHVDTR